MKRGKLGGNIASMIVWQLCNYVIPLLTFPYLTRVLGVGQFGVYALCFAIASYFVLITDWGFVLAAPGQIARAGDDREEINRVFWATLCAKSVLALGTFALIAVATLMSPAVRTIAPVLFCASGMVLANVLTVNWVLQGMERMGKFAIAATIGRIITVPATFLLVHTSSDAWIAALIQSAGAMTAGAVSIIMVLNLKVVAKPNLTLRATLDQMREGWPLFISALSANLYTSTNTVMLGVLRGPIETGLFGAADRLRMAAQSTITPISQAVYPRASRLMHEDRDRALAFARKLLLFQGMFTFCVTVAIMILAEPIIHILAGPHFLGSVSVLRVLAPIPFLVGMGNVFGVQLLLPLGMKKVFSRILIAAAVLDILIVVPLSWRFGAVGTACAALCAEGFVVAAMAVALMRAKIPIFIPPWRKTAP
jgi:O-antigen/teichoic acid export membrane protein